MANEATYLIKNTQIVNEGKIIHGDVFIKNGRIWKMAPFVTGDAGSVEIDGEGKYLLPGAIDDQVHFREPGLTQKGDIYTEARAAVAGGVTSYMEMPNVVPQTVTQDLLEQKYKLAAGKSLANYSFYIGATNDNMNEVLRTDPESVCGLKIFMGSSTGNMLVDDEKALDALFSNSPVLIATHCEDEATIRSNLEKYTREFGTEIPFELHPVIRNEEACYRSSSFAVELAKKHGTRLHVLHISSGKETTLFSNELPLVHKKITAEACIHHLWFSTEDYQEKQQWIKWNPAIKTPDDRMKLWEALLDDRIDVVATDHAPHTIAEKKNPYLSAPSGGPLIQHSLVAMLELYHGQKISLEKIAEKMAHAVADCFRIRERGYIREGYHADLVLADIDKPWMVDRSNILAKCGWSPFEGQTFRSSIDHVWVSGHLAYQEGRFDESVKGERLFFDRN